MAKDKKSKVKVPKKIAGVKVAKPVRKAGKQALKFVASQPAVSEAVAAAMLAAAAALRDPPAAKRAAAGAAGAAGQASQDAIRLADTVRAFAIDTARRMLDAWEAAEAQKGKARGGGKG